ncbi:S24 family peptidase [Shewanella sp.]|uniref:S24 family peptidase n=1 Tax=Shewanella sp. TaxID=50422 RepID=UPI003D1040AE
MMNERIKSRRKELRLSQESLGKLVGVTKATISLWENGTTSPVAENFHKLGSALRCSPEYLLYGIDTTTEKKPSQSATYVGTVDAWDDSTPLGEDEVELPYYTEVQLAAGNGIIAVSENRGPKLRFSKVTLRNQKVDPLAAVCVKVAGNSMEPVLPNGTTVGIDTASKNIVDGKMYAINHDGMLRIKLLYKLPGNGIRIRSYNQDEYPDEIYPGDQAKVITVIGKIFWYSVLL